MRREFTNKVRAEIVHRAMNERGQVCCEGCGLVLGKKAWHIDHTTPDALCIDKSAPLTAADGKLLGVECCHAPKTADDVANIARAKRREGKHYGFKARKRPFPGSRADRLKKHMDGSVSRRET